MTEYCVSRSNVSVDACDIVTLHVLKVNKWCANTFSVTR